MSTRNKIDSYTAYRTLNADCAPDGGQFVPMQIPSFGKQELRALQDRTFCEIVAQVLNLFFSARLTGWDIECCGGRNPVRLERMNHRLIVAEAWHNPGGTYAWFEQAIYQRICGNPDTGNPTQWARIAIYIALLFALIKDTDDEPEPVDIAVNTADFVLPIAAVYAREMGLPIGTIICACNENGAVWDMIHRGEFNTNAQQVHTNLPHLDISRPAAVEQLIWSKLGFEATERYLAVCARKGTFRVDEDTLAQLTQGLFSAVVGTERARSIINSMYRSNQYLIDPYTALSFGGLQDYRSRTGESRYTLLFAQDAPAHYVDEIADSLGVTAVKVQSLLQSEE